MCSSSSFSFYINYGKRFFDFVISFAALALLSPLLLSLSLLILIVDGSPIIFTQNRVGKDRSQFKIYKFRTMRNTSTSNKAEFDAGQTDRITYIGKILRKTKIDETPQLVNVLKGNMSLIGPRPEVPKWTNHYSEDWDVVLSIRPGITDQASIVFRNEEQELADAENSEAHYLNEILPRKLHLSLIYSNNISFLGDLKIIAKTLKAIIFN